jgi:hypothetical protein
MRQQQRFAVHGDLGFVHGFEKSRLCARGGAIDFIGENDVCENRTGSKLEFAGFGIVNADAENVAGQKVRSELDALESAVKRFCESLRESGLANAGYVFDKQMAASLP